MSIWSYRSGVANQIRASFGGNQDAAVAVAVGRCRSGALTAATSSKGGKFPWKFPTWMVGETEIGWISSIFLGVLYNMYTYTHIYIYNIYCIYTWNTHFPLGQGNTACTGFAMINPFADRQSPMSENLWIELTSAPNTFLGVEQHRKTITLHQIDKGSKQSFPLQGGAIGSRRGDTCLDPGWGWKHQGVFWGCQFNSWFFAWR